MKYLRGEERRKAEIWLRWAAQYASFYARCQKSRCGAVIVKDGRIVSAGYNAPPLDDERHRRCHLKPRKGKPNYDRTCCVHAEWRAIVDALMRTGRQLNGSKLYFVRVGEKGQIKKSGKPYCTVCSRLALDAGIGAFVLWHEKGICEYGAAEYNRLSYEYDYRRDKNKTP